MKLKRIRGEIECEFCGKKFMQTRWWQVFCSKKCKESSSATAKSEVRSLRLEVENLKKQLQEALNNAGTHSSEPKSFKYDDENQDLNYD